MSAASMISVAVILLMPAKRKIVEPGPESNRSNPSTTIQLIQTPPAYIVHDEFPRGIIRVQRIQYSTTYSSNSYESRTYLLLHSLRHSIRILAVTR